MQTLATTLNAWLPEGLGWLDLVALGFMLLVWFGYGRYSDSKRGRRGVAHVTDRLREDWMMQMLDRELRMPDIIMVQSLMRSVTFFASTAMIIIGGLLAALAAGDVATKILSDLGLAGTSSQAAYEVKVLVLVLIFVHGFFHLSWSLRQYNYVCFVIAAAPPMPVPVDEKVSIALRGAGVASRASLNFNRGLRAYYFGLSALAWLLHPVLFMVACAATVSELHRRDFRSRTLKALTEMERELRSNVRAELSAARDKRDAA